MGHHRAAPGRPDRVRAGRGGPGQPGRVRAAPGEPIVEAIARKLRAPQALVADDIVHAGNTSSASIPLALSRMIERGDIASGDAVLLLGFGAGISYAAQVIKVP